MQLWAEAFPTLSDDDRLFIARNILVAPNVDDVGSPRSDFTAPPLSGMFREHIDNSDLSRLSASLMQLPASTIAAVFCKLLLHVEQRARKSGSSVRVVAVVDALDEITEVRLQYGGSHRTSDDVGVYEDPVQTFYEAVDGIIQGCKSLTHVHLTFVVSCIHRPPGARTAIDVSNDLFMSDRDIAAVCDSRHFADTSEVAKFRDSFASWLWSFYRKHKDLRVTLLMGKLLVDVAKEHQADEKPELLQARLKRIIDGMKDARMIQVISTYMCHCMLSAPGTPDAWAKCVRAASDILAMVCFTGQETVPSCLSGIMFSDEDVDGAKERVWKPLLQRKAGGADCEFEFERVVVDVITRECNDEASFNHFWERFLVDCNALQGRSEARQRRSQLLLKHVDASERRAGCEGVVKRACRIGWDKCHLVSLSTQRLNALDTADASSSLSVLKQLLKYACDGQSVRCVASVFSRLCRQAASCVSLAECGSVSLVMTLAVQGRVPTGVRMFRVEEACKEVEHVLLGDLPCLLQVPRAASDIWTDVIGDSMQSIMNFLRVRRLSERIATLVRTWSAVLPERFQMHAWQWIIDAAVKKYRNNPSKANLKELEQYEYEIAHAG